VKVLIRFFVLSFLSVSALSARADIKKPDPAPANKSVPALEKPEPETVDDLRAIQQRVKEVLKKVMPSTVGLQVGGASGSGVIIDKEGHILTAAHVSGPADRPVTIILSDGRRIKGKTLGGNRGIDSGLIKITDMGAFPFVEMGKSASLKRGQWVIATGHPGGYRPGRTPPVRLGRVLDFNNSLIRTDCTLVGGDSGGPLFDLEGRVIGIHSRIAGRITDNIHVPVDTFRDTWDRLAKGEVWGGGLFGGAGRDQPYLGVELDTDAKGCKVAKVVEKTPAEKAGLKADDVILKFDGQALESAPDLRTALGKKKIGDSITLSVQRGDMTLDIKVTLGRRDN
jgi:serine protease Do